MDKAQAIVAFWKKASGLPVYDENIIPDTAVLPYLTCEVSTASFEHEIPLTANLYYRDTSWEAISIKADAIAKAIYEMRGTSTKIDGGRFRVWEGETPLLQRASDATDDAVRRIVINVMVEFMTNY